MPVRIKCFYMYQPLLAIFQAFMMQGTYIVWSYPGCLLVFGNRQASLIKVISTLVPHPLNFSNFVTCRYKLCLKLWIKSPWRKWVVLVWEFCYQFGPFKVINQFSLMVLAARLVLSLSLVIDRFWSICC